VLPVTQPSELAPPQWVAVARIRRPQGRRGEVFADILTDFPERFSSRRRLWLIPSEDKPARSAAKPVASLLGTRDSGDLASAGAPRFDSKTRNTVNTSPLPREVELVHHWLHKGGIVLGFAGIDSISAAEALKGLTIAIPFSERAPLAEDEFYIADLIGCTLTNVAGPSSVMVGIIRDVDLSAGPTPLLVLKEDRGEILVPFAKSYLRHIDIAAKHVDMALPDGLLDLNISE
jgi:16S rRNA processing protein RimM